MGIKVDLTCDNCGKELLRQKEVVYANLSFCDKVLYFCDETCEKEFFTRYMSVETGFTNEVVYAYLNYDLGLKTSINRN